jgi:Domain of unknown function (DUF4397)
MRLGGRLVLLAAAITALGGLFAAVATASPGAYAATTAAPPSVRAGAMSVAAEQGNVGWVRCANLAQGTPQDVYLYSFGNPENPTVLRHESYGGVSGYMPVSAGEYTVAVRPVGAAASSPASITTSFMVSAGTNYTVASIGSSTGRRLQVLQDKMAGPGSEALVRVIQASAKQLRVTVSVGADSLARQLAFGSVTDYQAVTPGTPSVVFSTPDGHTAMPVALAAGSVHTIVVLDGTSGLKVDNLTDAAASQVAAKGGAATGLGGTAPGPPAAGLTPWLATLAGGLLLAVAGGFGLRRSRSPGPARQGGLR